jgi:glycosyltransferase involved in cell wall biosynthesis
MRIAYVLTSLGVGGAEGQVVALAERMALRGHAVSLVVLRPRQAEEWPTPLDVVRLEMRKTPTSLFAGLARSSRFLRGFQPDLLHSHTFYANMTARLLHLLALLTVARRGFTQRRPVAPVISTIHNIYEGRWPRMLAYRLTDPLSRHTTAVSQAAAARFVRLKALSVRKSSVVTNGIDTAEFAPNLERRSSLRARMGVEEEFVWLAAGRIAAAKDYPNLLRAFARVHAVAADARLWIAGEAVGNDLTAIKALTAELGLADAVRWLGLRHDMPALLDAADGFVLASAWEGMPLAVGEAMAMEKPVVATDVGGVRELVGEAGLIAAAKSPEELAASMLALMWSASEARVSLGRAARKRIQEKFSIEARVDEWEALYRRVLERKI